MVNPLIAKAARSLKAAQAISQENLNTPPSLPRSHGQRFIFGNQIQFAVPVDVGQDKEKGNFSSRERVGSKQPNLFSETRFRC